MAATAKTNRVSESRDVIGSFDIVCTIGTVHYSDDPHEASAAVVAFGIIGAHGADGVYSFPNGDGSTVTVTVDNFHP